MDIRELNKGNEKFLEFTENPDDFETESERKMNLQTEQEIDSLYQQDEKKRKQQWYKERNIGIKRIKKFLDTLPFTNLVEIIRDRQFSYIKFYVPEKYFDKITKWEEKSNMLRKSHLKLSRENASQGYIVIIS